MIALRWFYIIRLRLRALLQRKAVERELQDEFHYHLDQRIDQEIARGADLSEARRRAALAMEGIEQKKEECRDLRGVRFVQDLLRDLNYAFRSMRKERGFMVVTVLSLALAIGVNGALLSIVDALLLRTLPVADAHRLVIFKRAEPDNRIFHDLPYPMFERLRGQPEVFSEVTANWPIERTEDAEVPGVDPGIARIGMAAGNYFSALGVHAATGRMLAPDDNRVPGAHPVAVISHAYWKRRFAMNRDVVGRTVRFAGTAFVIIGVTPEEFTGEWAGRPIDIWVPFMMASQVMPEVPGGPSRFPALVVGRLKPGVSLEQAQAFSQLRYQQALRGTAGDNLSSQQANALAQRKIFLESAATGFSLPRQSLIQPLLILAMMAGLGLLAVCVSLANLLLARTEARERELAVRQALGAGRFRIVRQLLTEGVLLAALGGLFGVLLVYWNTGLMSTLLAAGPLAPQVEDHTLLLDIRVGGRVVASIVFLTAVISVLFGLTPALRTAKHTLTGTLKERGAARATAAGGFGMVRTLVIAQVAITLVLVTGVGLLLRTLQNLQSEDLGFERERLLLVWSAPARTGRTVPVLASLAKRVHERLSTVPGVVRASVSSGGVLDGGTIGGRSDALQFEGLPPKSGLPLTALAVSPDYFRTVGIPVIQGREIQTRDSEGSAPVAVINETMARFYFPGENPVGKRFGPSGEQGYPIEIVGVVKDAKLGTPRDQRGAWYFPYHQNPRFLRLNWCIALRTAGSPIAVASSVQQVLREIDPNLAILRVNTVEAQLNYVLARERLIVALAGFFGGLAVLLSCLGLYGLISLRIVRRRSEIGIRLALGATPGSVMQLIIRESLMLVLVGILIGLPIALALTRWLSTWLFGVGYADPITFAATTSLMLVVAVSAAFVPARRARSIDAMVALRNE